MKGDFSRIRFNPARQYTAVLEQQGRVDLDADSNEQRAIELYRAARTNLDVIGRFGGPENDAGFAIHIVNGEILISPGRYYVEGMLVENRELLSYDAQKHLVNPALSGQDLLKEVVQGQTTLQFVLEVWQRLVTALDDPCLVEPALGQADTTARLQTVWRVVGSVIADNSKQGPPPSGPIAQLSPCCQLLYNELGNHVHTGAMGAGTSPAGDDCGCQPVAAAGYQGLENQLYRVEIHTAGDLSSATFKWSRENGSVVARVTQAGANSSVLTVNTLGPDANLGFQSGQWVELSDDTDQFGPAPNQPGTLYQILSVNQATRQVTLTSPVTGLDPNRHARMRRWDQAGASASAAGIPVSATPIPLENGIEVNFRDGQFQSGDYWTIPARTANGKIDWPPCGSDGRHFQPASYIAVARAPLACVQIRASVDRLLYKPDLAFSGKPLPAPAQTPSETAVPGLANTGSERDSRFRVNDCRLLFPPLTDVAAETVASALHVTAISWKNDDIMTVDAMLQGGLSVTFDQPTICPWGGGNFKVSLELPYLVGDTLAVMAGKLPGMSKPTFTAPPGTDCFLRTVMALDPPWGITVSGNTVSWIKPYAPAGQVNYGIYEVLFLLDTLLGGLNPTGLARVRIRLIGGAIYGEGDSGNLYLDGASFGDTGSRALDSSESISYNLPSGNSSVASDYEGWFYLAPTVVIASVVIQGVENGVEKTVTALKVLVNSNNQVIGYQVGETQSVGITGLQALITLSYPPIAPTPVTLLFTPGGGVVNIAASVTIPAGQVSYTTPISIPVNPGQGIKETYTLIASVSTAIGPLAFSPAPTLTVTGMAAPPQ